MKVAVTSQGPGLDSALDPRFGRAAYLLVVNTETGEWSAADNTPNLNAAQGAGIQAGKKVVELGAEALITGHVGPKAFTALRAGNVKVYTVVGGTVAEAVERFRKGELSAMDAPDVEGHWV